MYTVRTAAYEGPLDLLLELIRKNEFDLHNLPISDITKQYLDELEQIGKQDAETTASFMRMTATLLAIKAELLLPNVSEEDPREELVRQLMQHEQHKQAVLKMKELREMEQRFLKREKQPKVKREKKSGMELLIATYQSILRKKQRAKKDALGDLLHLIQETRYTVQDQMAHLRSLLEEPINIEHLLDETKEREEIIVTFSAVLELIKNREAVIEIRKETVWLCRKEEGK